MRMPPAGPAASMGQMVRLREPGMLVVACVAICLVSFMLSTVAPLLGDIATSALDLLDEQLDDDHVPQHRMAGYELRIRESSTR